MVDLIAFTDPLLRQSLEEFDFGQSEQDPVALARDMADLMLRRGGIGLAANQVGLNKRVLVIWGHPVLPMFNPVVTASSDDEVLLDEACLSFPQLTLAVKRPRVIRVRFQLPSGEHVVRRFDGLTSRVVQHEVDHLDGKLFFQYASRPKIEAAIRRAKKAGVEYAYHELMGKKR